MHEGQPRRERRWDQVVSLIVFFTIVPALFSWLEAYRNFSDPIRFWFSLEPTVFDRLLIVWCAWCALIYALAIPIAVALGLAAAGWLRTAWTIAYVCTAALLAWSSLDGRVFRVTGNHVLSYAQNLGADDAGQWIGGIATSAPLVVTPLAWCVVSLILCAAFATTIGSAARKRSVRLVRSAVVAALLIGAGLFLALIPAQAGASSYRLLAAIESSLSLSLPLLDVERHCPPQTKAFRDRFQESMRLAPAEVLDGLRKPAPVERGLPSGGPLPHVVLIVLESFRFEAIETMMPRLNAWGAGGLRMARHYAGSNRSEFGLFSLLYGQNGLRYQGTLRAGVAPQLCASLQELGYQRHYAAGAGTNWAGMQAFLNERNFESLEIDLADTWPTRDARILENVAARLKSATGPQFIMTFLMSTHYDFQYPPEFEIHKPVAVNLSANVRNASHLRNRRESILNRYRNAAGYLDALLADLLAKIDPANTIVVVTGDHGESIFDDGVLSHSSRLSEIQLRVPMLIVGPGIPARTLARATSHVDLPATILHAITGTDRVLPATAGRSLLGEIEDDRILLFQVRAPSAPTELLFIDGQERLRVDLLPDGALRAIDFVDDRAVSIPHEADPTTAPAWANQFSNELRGSLGQE